MWPQEGAVYDYVWDKARGVWRHWMDPTESSAAGAAAAIPESAAFNEIIVPTGRMEWGVGIESRAAQ